MMKRTLLFVLMVLLAGCQTLVSDDPASPHYMIPIGSKLVLKKPLSLSRNQVSFYIQDGEVISAFWRKQYYPHCRFEMWTRMSQERVIQPDEFIIKKVEKDYRITRHLRGPIKVADLRLMVEVDGPAIEIDSTILYLHSDRQPDVYRLTCEHWNDPIDARHLTVPEIRKTLEGMFELHLKTD